MAEPTYRPITEASSNKLAELWRRIVTTQVPLGSYEYGLGVDVNDVLKPLTDTRGSDRMLPETVSLEDVGAALAKVPHIFDVKSMAEGQVKAQDTPVDPDEAYGAWKRLLELFPMWGAEAGGAVKSAQTAGTTTLGTYGGRKNATANLERLAQAQTMEKAGASAGPSGETRQVTGWFKDKAGDWKYEIPDNGFVLRDPYEFLTADQREQLFRGEPVGVRLGDMAEHPALFGGYPHMADFGVTLDPKLPGDTASFSPADKTIHMGIIADRFAPVDHRVRFTPQHRLSALHEITHGVQHEEGFAQGGNPSLIARHKAGVMDEIDATRAQYNRLRGQGVPMEDPSMMALKQRIADMTERLSKFPSDDYTGYQRLLGEAEARDVEARADLDPASRQMSTPYASTGIRPEDMLIRKRGASVDDADISMAVRNAGADQPPPLNTEGFAPVFPQPERMMDPGAPDFTPGGRYLEMPGRTDITGQSPMQGHVSIGPDGKPMFLVSPGRRPEPTSRAGGATVKTNLFKQSAGWKWVDRAEGVPEVPTLVSVTTGGRHYYTLAADFSDGVNLTRYADAPTEPRLRPTTYGDVDLGPQVGTISVRGKEHPVYQRATVRSKVDDRSMSLPDPGGVNPPGPGGEPPFVPTSLDEAVAPTGSPGGSASGAKGDIADPVASGQVPASDQSGGLSFTQPVTYQGKDLSQWTDQDFAAFGREHGVDNLGPLTPPEVVRDQTGREIEIPGGFEGKFTYYDLLHLKSQGINADTLDPALHTRLAQKLGRTMTPEQLTPEHIFNGILFGITSPNQPLLPNQMAASRLKVGSMDDIGRIADMIPWRHGDQVPKDVRKQYDSRIAENFGLQAGSAGGLGIKGSQDYTRIAELAQMFQENPDWFRLKPGEAWADYVDRLSSQVTGLGTKTGSFSSVWQNPAGAQVSAMDRHMAQRMFEELFPAKSSERKDIEKALATRWNDKVQTRRDLEHQLKKKEITPAEFDRKTTYLGVGTDSKMVRGLQGILGQSGGDGFFTGYMLEQMGAGEKKLNMAKGGRNPSLSLGLQQTDWIREPEYVKTASPLYRQALDVNAADAASQGLSLFMSQWRGWDRQRKRLEPHENMFPGLEKLPRPSNEQLRAALKAHTQTGHLDYTKENQLNAKGELEARLRPTRPTDNPAGLAFFSRATPVPVPQEDQARAAAIAAWLRAGGM